MKSWLVTTDKGAVNKGDLVDLYHKVGCGVPDCVEDKNAYMDSLFGAGCYGFFVFEQGRVIGCARVMSDDLVSTWVAELIVHPDWQDLGVGTSLVKALKERFKYTSIHLDALLGQQGFFEKNGIKPRDRLVACTWTALRKVS
ncbi:GNAT family N-acetyltransferase [Terasakiella sp. A23]|uniref:GNAT family N-acetyltransferase n=1 Tax=Terasakiella sp. FCG-A23 TaxID=3080561 RepID=UPI002955544D|nr:GNAT family N-acetyltransferase [Terasakiella sp. A23]MDV7340208.1 GNAT family N-acetyltransferase [Terasakiella sp. A23]